MSMVPTGHHARLCRKGGIDDIARSRHHHTKLTGYTTQLLSRSRVAHFIRASIRRSCCLLVIISRNRQKKTSNQRVSRVYGVNAHRLVTTVTFFPMVREDGGWRMAAVMIKQCANGPQSPGSATSSSFFSMVERYGYHDQSVTMHAQSFLTVVSECQWASFLPESLQNNAMYLYAL
ncbi:hypothetical protein EV363DRAFT_1436648 [Boletus edulis]|uniref:Uncharacterized protein n=1 Tax=Boletus edulis BED1 TaxID=1328754 RepID=A0AAD4BI92_BOLED|nr:hypothetical protein EV363DRAFT_1436648 [Boletus edulis]KAF8430868.1 hypothetical protein L210DRAFT_3018890 [Boletus edulis BED1]